MGTILETFRNYRFINNAMAALLGAMVVALAVDIAIDAEWIADLFFIVFAGSLFVFYRGRFAPAKPPGMGLTALAWLLVGSVVVLAVLRVGTHLGRLV
jgi:hypothetical protein